MTNKTIMTSVIVLGVIFSVGLTFDQAYAAVFAKYDGVDGESTDVNHDKWIDVLSIDWGVFKTRNTQGFVAPAMEITMDYDKASPKLLEAVVTGKVIPKLEIEQTARYGGERSTYLKYELTNVIVSSYQTHTSGTDSGPPTVVVGNNFEEIKVTYTEFDDEGNPKSTSTTSFKVNRLEIS